MTSVLKIRIYLIRLLAGKMPVIMNVQISRNADIFLRTDDFKKASGAIFDNVFVAEKGDVTITPREDLSC